MDNVRPVVDATVYTTNGLDWVSAAQSSGVSTRAVKKGLKGTWWVLPAGATFDDRLLLVNDHGRHWAWRPAIDMEMAEYVRLLSALNPAFRLA
jgi:hypothetical protein